MLASVLTLCLVGSNHTALNLNDVMDGFRDSLMTADQVADQGQSAPSSVSDTDLQTAVNSVGVAIDCATQVIDHPTPELQPPGTVSKSGQERTTYLNDFYNYFGRLKEALSSYQNLFSQTLQQPIDKRDFTALKEQESAIRTIEVEAHSHF